MITVMVLGQGRGQGKGQQFIFIKEIEEKSIKCKFKKHYAMHYDLIEPVGIKQTEVDLRSRTAVMDTTLNISLPPSYETSYWLSRMTGMPNVTFINDTLQAGG